MEKIPTRILDELESKKYVKDTCYRMTLLNEEMTVRTVYYPFYRGG